MPYDLKGRNVLITGGSACVQYTFPNHVLTVTNALPPSGLGELLSTTFASEGANVAINYFNRIEPAQKVQKACQEHGVKAVVVKAVSLVV